MTLNPVQRHALLVAASLVVTAFIIEVGLLTLPIDSELAAFIFTFIVFGLPVLVSTGLAQALPFNSSAVAIRSVLTIALASAIIGNVNLTLLALTDTNGDANAPSVVNLLFSWQFALGWIIISAVAIGMVRLALRRRT